jgi:hypothetical protein
MKLSKTEQRLQQEAILSNEEFKQLKKDEYRRKKLTTQAENNRKSNVGFGYTYKPLQFDFADVPVEQVNTKSPKGP